MRRYALAESFPEHALPRSRPGIFDPHLGYLDQRLAQGCENVLALWRELRARGFPGTRRQVSRWLQPLRQAPSPFGPRLAGIVALVRRFANLVRGSSVTAASPCRVPVRTFRNWVRTLAEIALVKACSLPRQAPPRRRTSLSCLISGPP